MEAVGIRIDLWLTLSCCAHNISDVGGVSFLTPAHAQLSRCPTVWFGHTWVGLQTPQVKGTVPPDCPHFKSQRQESGPFVRLGMTSGVPVSTGSLLVSFNSLLELFRKLQSVIHPANWESCLGPGMRASAQSPHALSRSSTLPEPPCVHQAPSPAVGAFYGGPGHALGCARLSRWPSLQPLSCPHSSGWGELPSPLITWSVPLARPPS